ncbi:hypothetical protein INH39_28800 [Massilia violaceinigra]|uniref:Oxidoreductase n=1 Tax=Massilia violaceinigra TaxID=2045208 RepID=A0ABY4A4R5_9BURK|nr:hypothetical protein [Massilia violaceinigra]UOD29362.1 hypothetical protein INH39_28800 [Massilia violaceinigra]
MERIFDEASWRKYVSGYTFYDCAILSEHEFGFILVEERDSWDDDDDRAPMTRFVAIDIDEPIERRFRGAQTGAFSGTTIAASEQPRAYVAVDSASKVHSIEPERSGDERAIDRVLDMSIGNGMLGTVRKAVRAAGKIYALGIHRKIYRRIGVDQWIEFGAQGNGVPMPADLTSQPDFIYTLGFNDMSAFSKNDMYAVGGEGDAWRFDGEQWHQCSIPTAAKLTTVCCAGNGLVYITEQKGSVWEGRADRWQKVTGKQLPAGFYPVDSVWFNNRLYLGTQCGIFTLDKKRGKVVDLKEAEEDAPDPANSGRLDLSEDGRFLLTVGPYGACIHDGTTWCRLFSALDFS